MDGDGRPAGVDFRLEIAEPHAHLYGVTLTLHRPRAGQVFSLPVWIPGSYLVRDFSRHLSPLQAMQAGRELGVRALDKARWQVDCSSEGALTLRYRVYAFDGSPRGAFLDAQRGFFNGSSLFLQTEGQEHAVHRLQLGPLPAGWEVATAMRGSVEAGFVAADYPEFIDHPFELGSFWQGRFELRGVPHELVVTGAGPSFDGERLLADTRRVCEAQAAVWGEQAMPFDRYVFLLRTVEDAHGDGLEHRASTALRAARRDLPRPGAGDAGEGTLSLLSLIAHEYFHAWNVKRLRPRDLDALDLSKEQPTTLLWFFEGVTSYCDERALRRCGLVDAAGWLRLLAKTASGLLGQPGRHLHSVAEASRDAWIKLYKSDENTPNATVNYYTKGALVALLLDLALLEAGSSLDELLRALWQRSGGGAIDEGDIFETVAALGGPALGASLQAWVHGTDELPLAAALASVGVRWTVEPGGPAARLGLKLSEGPVTGMQVRQVLRGSAAEAAGVSAGDEILAVDGWRLRRFDELRQGLVDERPGASFELLIVRDQHVQTCRVTWPSTSAAPTVMLTLDPRAEPGALALRRRWLGP